MRIVGDSVFLSLEEASHVLGVHIRTIQRWIAKRNARPKHAPLLTLYLFPDGRKYVRQEEIQNAYEALLGTRISANVITSMLENARQRARAELLLHREWKADRSEREWLDEGTC
jgi:hypothetical protein